MMRELVKEELSGGLLKVEKEEMRGGGGVCLYMVVDVRG